MQHSSSFADGAMGYACGCDRRLDHEAFSPGHRDMVLKD